MAPLFVNTTGRQVWFTRGALLLTCVLLALAAERVVRGISRPVPLSATPLPLKEAPWHSLVDPKPPLPWLLSSSDAWTPQERAAVASDPCALVEIVDRYYPYWHQSESCQRLQARKTPPMLGDVLVLEESARGRLQVGPNGVEIVEQGQ